MESHRFYAAKYFGSWSSSNSSDMPLSDRVWSTQWLWRDSLYRHDASNRCNYKSGVLITVTRVTEIQWPSDLTCYSIVLPGKTDCNLSVANHGSGLLWATLRTLFLSLHVLLTGNGAISSATVFVINGYCECCEAWCAKSWNSWITVFFCSNIYIL